MLDGELPMSEYKEIKDRYLSLIKKLQDEMSEPTRKTSDYKKYLDFGFNLLENADLDFTTWYQGLWLFILL